MWARAELQSSHGIWVVFLWWKQVWGFIFGVGFLDKDNSWSLRRSEWSFHHLVVPAERNHICCDSFVQMLHVFTYTPKHYTAWTACLLSRVSRYTSLMPLHISKRFCLTGRGICSFQRDRFDWKLLSLSDVGLKVNFIFLTIRPLQRRRQPYASHHPLQPDPRQPHWGLLQQLRPRQQ